MSQKPSVSSDRPKTTISFHPELIRFLHQQRITSAGLSKRYAELFGPSREPMPSLGSFANACGQQGVSAGTFIIFCDVLNASMKWQHTYGEFADPNDFERVSLIERNLVAGDVKLEVSQRDPQRLLKTLVRQIEPMDVGTSPRCDQQKVSRLEPPIAIDSDDIGRVILVKPEDGGVPEAALISAVQMDATGEDMHVAIAHQEFELASPTTSTQALAAWPVLLKRIPLVWKASITVAAVSIVALSMSVFITHMGRGPAHAQFKANLTKINHATDASFEEFHPLKPFSIVKDAILHPFSMTPDTRRLAMLQQQDASLGHLVYYSDEPQSIKATLRKFIVDYDGGNALVFVYLINEHQQVIVGSNSHAKLSTIAMDGDVIPSDNYRIIAVVFPLDETQAETGSLKFMGVPNG